MSRRRNQRPAHNRAAEPDNISVMKTQQIASTRDAGAIFADFEKHLIRDDQPSLYFNGLMETGSFPASPPFDLLGGLVGVKQSPVHHPEGDVWAHTMLVVDNAAQLKQASVHPRALMWAALLHDVGKKETTRVRKGRITAYDHDKAGKRLAEQFLRMCGTDEAFVAAVGALVRWHMQALYASRHLPFFNPRAMMAEANVDEVALLCLCDRLGRGPVTAQDVERERAHITAFIEKSRRSGK